MEFTTAIAVPPIDTATQSTPLVRTDAGQGGMAADFSNVLEGFRQRAAKAENAGRGNVVASDKSSAAIERSMRQLADLYTYAVDMQVMVRTGGQLTGGVRQLITGQ